MQKRFHESLSVPVWVRTDYLSLLLCALTSASDGSGELTLDDPCIVPDRFDLLFSPTAQSWRECSVRWRKYHTKSIGITFLSRHISTTELTERPRLELTDDASQQVHEAVGRNRNDFSSDL